MTPQTFVFFGQVGSGKGTQVKLLTEFLKSKGGKETVYAGPGSEYRRITESGNYTGQIIKESVTLGNLQPDFLTDSLVMNILINNMGPDKHLIFDAYPRTVGQAETLTKMINFYKRSDIKIIYIELGKDEAMKRNLLRGRADDTKEGIQQRFNEYVNKVLPAMNYFKDKVDFTIHTINGEQSIEDVHKDIIKALGY
jgi:adenylate kinase